MVEVASTSKFKMSGVYADIALSGGIIKNYIFSTKEDCHMLDIIGNAAGQIWNVLFRQEGPISMTELSRITKLKSQVVYQALGWLAREGKIEYHKKGATVCVKLISS